MDRQNKEIKDLVKEIDEFIGEIFEKRNKPYEETCKLCEGYGWIGGFDNCPRCKGTGRIDWIDKIKKGNKNENREL